MRSATAAVAATAVASLLQPTAALGGAADNYTWEIVNQNAVSSEHLRDPGVWLMGTTPSLEACMEACAANASCNSCDWSGNATELHGGHCQTISDCYFRGDTIWEPAKDGHCNHSAARKVPIAPAPAPITPKPPRGYQPNIVFFLQDDQDLALGGWTPMAQASKLLVDQGAEAQNWFIHTPVCCPSRGEMLSGRYFHNIREPNSKGGCMHIDEGKVNPQSFGTFLQRAGYTVGYFGKHMNSCPKLPPPGFDCPTCYWFANGGGKDGEPGGYLNASFNQYAQDLLPGNENGTYKADTNGEFAGYTTAVIANKSIEWIRRVAALDKPFMVTVASKGPHVPATPAPWYANAFANLSAPRTPDYNASAEVLADHHWLIAQQGPITQDEGVTIDELFRNRWRTLLSIDDAVAGVHATIDDLGLLNSTYFIISSDHGYNLGQHRLPSCKLNVYDHDIRIPMVISGPGIRAGLKFENPGSNVDLAPTFLGLAGVDSLAQHMDGRSIVPLLVDPKDPNVAQATRDHIAAETARFGTPSSGVVSWRDHHMVEYYSLGSVTRTGHLVDDPKSNTYRALRFTSPSPYGDLLYAEFTAVTDWDFAEVSFHELYNVTADPHQLTNLYANAPADLKVALAAQLDKEWHCEGQVGDNPCNW